MQRQTINITNPTLEEVNGLLENRSKSQKKSKNIFDNKAGDPFNKRTAGFIALNKVTTFIKSLQNQEI